MRVKPFTAYIAVSSAGYPAFFLGYARTAKQLKADYAARFPAEVERYNNKSAFLRAGYRSVKVVITESAK